jgi:hypothetical protein
MKLIQKDMKNEFIKKVRGNRETLYYDLSDFVRESNRPCDGDKKFVREFIENNNFDGEFMIIEITTNENEMSFFVQHIVNSYISFLHHQGFRIT